MTDQVGQRRWHQATDSGEQHQALVNIASLSIQESRRQQDRERDEIAERIDRAKQRIRLDVEIAAQVRAAARHRNRCHAAQNDHDRGEGMRPEFCRKTHWRSALSAVDDFETKFRSFPPYEHRVND